MEKGQEGKEVDLKHDPPVIFYSSKPANLIVFDGDPVMNSVQGANLLFAVNTNWDVILDPDTSTYYLLDGSFWLSATDYKGPWKPITQLPAAFNNLPNDKNFGEVKQHIPGTRINEKDLPVIFVSTQPAVIILTKGTLSAQDFGHRSFGGGALGGGGLRGGGLHGGFHRR
jgi:hypothetical protein